MRGLYAIVDTDTLDAAGVDVLSFGDAVIAARPAALQLRAKRVGARRFLALATELATKAQRAEVRFFVNDRVDLALLAGAYGVHVGQTDLEPEAVRRIAPALKVGLSTHTPQELEAALAETPDYVAFGPVFATQSKSGADPVVGVAGLERAAILARRAGIPLVAIGGIDAASGEAVSRHADAGALIAALGTELAGLTERCRDLHRALGGTT
ncbi:MAG: thiamine phosphate synthase [Polyangiaceae bacterium]